MNRVLTGYAWNKYTQTHFDPENPYEMVFLIVYLFALCSPFCKHAWALMTAYPCNP